MDKPTKFYSEKQENLIAGFLGWKTVAASGARSFNQGDIKSDRFLGECKTHTESKDTVFFLSEVWKKINMEAFSNSRRPILFVDNGTQTVENTWCIFNRNLVLQDSAIEYEKIAYIRYTTRGFNFNHDKMKSLLGDMKAIRLDWLNQPMVLMNLYTFKQILAED